MDARSLIAIEDNLAESLVIYCHYDGYPSHQMPLLNEKYNTPVAIRKLLSMGDLSCLETGKDWNLQPMEPQPLPYRMLGTTHTEMQRIRTTDLRDYAREHGADYVYLFRGAHGWCYWKVDLLTQAAAVVQ